MRNPGAYIPIPEINTLWFKGVNARPCDERLDIMDAESYDHDNWSGKCSDPEVIDCRRSWDSDQALEIIAAEPGWLFGEQFYDAGTHQDPEDDWSEFDKDEFVKEPAPKDS